MYWYIILCLHVVLLSRPKLRDVSRLMSLRDCTTSILQLGSEVLYKTFLTWGRTFDNGSLVYRLTRRGVDNRRNVDL